MGENLMLSDRAHVIFPWHIAEDRVLTRAAERGEHRHHERGIGPCYCDKVAARTRSGWATCIGTFRARIGPSSRRRTRLLGASTARRNISRWTRTDLSTNTPTTPAAPAVRGRYDLLLARRGRGRDSGSCLKGPRARCSTWTTGPIRSSPAAIVRAWACRRIGRAGPLDQADDRRHQGLLTRVGGGPFPDRIAQRDRASTFAIGATNTARSRAGRGAAAGSTPWRCATRPG